jgi:AcrR family transcriptional regulator
MLLEEAARQFACSGFNGTSLAAIASACGLGNAGVLHHFPSKQALYKAVLEGLSLGLAEGIQAVLECHDAPADRLRAMIRHNVAAVIAHPGSERLILRELMDNAGRVEHARSLPLTRFVTTFCQLIEDAQAAGVTPPGAPIVLLTQFLGTLSYALVVRPTFARMGMEAARNEGHWIENVGAIAERTLLSGEPDRCESPTSNLRSQP